MHLATRMVLVLMLVLAVPGVLSAQEAETSTNTSDAARPQAATETTASDTASTDATATDTTGTAEGEETPRRQTNYETRNQFTSLLSRNAEELTTLLVLEPALLSNEEFLAGQPELARFVKAHPEVGLQPSFYLAEYGGRTSHHGPDIVEPLVTLFAFVLITFALGWIVRTIIEQKRWNRLTRTQNEVHNKILDRFGSSAELLEYVKSPAGTKYLESAPIPLRPEPPATQNVPLTRVIWSVQLGVITCALGVGLLLVSLRFTDSGDLFALGAIALCIGLGFIGSAAVTLLLSRRLGLWPSSPGASEPGPGGFVR
ncbi:MAG TPA: hypothetical protein VE974_09440 [Thermoanaerobaculia bacterium]|nr:hypothetical protein [Thermoanaerobaculia bacterium]